MASFKANDAVLGIEATFQLHSVMRIKLFSLVIDDIRMNFQFFFCMKMLIKFVSLKENVYLHI